MPDFLKVEEVLGNLDIKDSMTAVEFGCGSAHFTIALAKKLRQGKVYALDVQEDVLSALKGKLSQAKIGNVSTIVCDLEQLQGSTLQGSSADIVLIPNVLFQAESKHAMIGEGKRILKPQGQLLVVDWLREVPFGPKKEAMVPPDEIKSIARELNLQLKKEFAAGDYHYGLVFTKK